MVWAWMTYADKLRYLRGLASRACRHRRDQFVLRQLAQNAERELHQCEQQKSLAAVEKQVAEKLAAELQQLQAQRGSKDFELQTTESSLLRLSWGAQPGRGAGKWPPAQGERVLLSGDEMLADSETSASE